MDRCEAKTKAGRRCRNNARPGSDFCAVHADEVSGEGVVTALLGVVAGAAVAPTLPAMLIGGGVATILRRIFKENSSEKKRVFVSFDYDNDRALKDFIIGQSKLDGSPFEVLDHSLKEAAPEHNWEVKANAAIRRSDLVLVMVGRKTYRAHGVLKEVAMARAADVPIVQIIGYRDGEYTPVPNAGRLYSWSWDNLERLLG